MIIILGPTASGKTSLSIEVAKAVDGEIVGADSVQIYRDLVIGSSSPLKDEMDGVPHHLIGILNLSRRISAEEFSRMAAQTILEIESRGKVPIMVGGSNFYVDVFINGLSPVPEISYTETDKFNNKIEKIPTNELYSRLLGVDPEWAEGISSPNDRQRIKRGLIVYEKTGRKISDWNKTPCKRIYTGDISVTAIDIDRNELYNRINTRASHMVSNGIVQELQKINNRGFNQLNCQVLNSIGYRETGMYLSGEVKTKKELIDLIAKNTRHLAKKQLTWLRNRDYVNWIAQEHAFKQ